MQLLQNPLPSPLAVPIPIQSLSIFTKCKVSTALACHTCNFPPPAKYPYFPRNSRSISVAFDPSKISSLGITGPNSTARKTHTQNTMAIMKEDVERLDLSSAEKKGSCSGKQQESPSTISTTKSTEEPEAGKGGESCKKGQWHSMFPEYMQSRAEERQKEETTAEVAAAAAAAAASAMELECRVKLSQSSIGSVTSSVSAPPNSSARPPSQGSKPLTELMYADPIWAAMRVEARLEAEKEPLLSSFLYASILAHPCFERALGFVLANRLQNPTLLATQLMDVFDDVFMNDSDIQQSIRQDVQAVKDRDPSCRSYSWALLYLKGYHALQSYRVAHVLWSRGQRVLALSLQSRISEVFAVDIHPAARIGKGILLDHGTGIVIGETAVVGDRVSLLQGVTLGGTGKEVGDRHPKIGEGVLIGAGATILGNITIGKGAMVAAGSLVLKDIPPHSMVAGTPAKVVGCLEEQNPALTMQHDVTKEFCELVAEDYLHGGAGI